MGVHLYYDKEGNEITLEEWSDLFGDIEYKRIAFDQFDRYEVSTVWLGLDHSFSFDSEPVIFETMIFEALDEPKVIMGHEFQREEFGEGFGGYQERYYTEQEALEGHARACKFIQLELQFQEERINGNNNNV